MSNIFTFPGEDQNSEPIVFADFVKDTSKTKLLVLYNDDVSKWLMRTRMIINQSSFFLSVTLHLFLPT